MQVQAIMEAAVAVKKEKIIVLPEIMIPLVGTVRELTYLKKYLIDTAEAVMHEDGMRVDYLIGTMIEVPRAALTAGEIAAEAEFFSFGTNDLTQTCLGMSRDDSGHFLPRYQELEIIKQNPFATIDQNGVGALVKIAVEKGRQTRPDIKLGICGEHGGDPASVKFCHRTGLTYVSCSPFRVPIARLAAAQAALEEKAKGKPKVKKK
jgi:pyruvate,orthophosphate dikinase